MIYNPNSIPLRIPFAPNRAFNFAKPIKVTNRTTKLTNYQIEVNLNTSNFAFEKARADGADVRFQDANGKALSYWVESWTTTSAKIWVKLDELEAYEDRIIWLMYGNYNCMTASNGINTFTLFDDFNDNSFTGWNWDEGVAGNQAVEQNQRLELTTALNSYGHAEKSGLSSTFLAQVKLYRENLDVDYSWSPGLFIWFNARDWGSVRLAGTPEQFLVQKAINDVVSQDLYGVMTVDTWYWLRIRSDGTNIYFEKSTNGTDWTTLQSIAVPATWSIDTNSLAIIGTGYEDGATYPNPDLDNNYSSTGANIITYFDDFRVRKYAFFEPIVEVL